MKEKLNLTDSNGKISITNSTVFLFVAITAFKSIFAGLVITLPMAVWKIESLDIAATLPLLFSLLNYSHKRMETNKVIQNKE